MMLESTSDKIIIHASGLELLKLSSKIAERIGNISKVESNTISFPTSALPRVTDLLVGCVEQDSTIAKHIQDFECHGRARLKAIQIIDNQTSPGITQEWEEVLEPMQSTAVAAMVLPELSGLCLFDEQGSGKTVMGIAAFDIMMESQSIDGAIIICPKSMVSEWPKDFSKFTLQKYTVIEAQGSKDEKYKSSLKDFDVLVTNFEGLSVMLTTLQAVASNKRILLIADESYYLKNQDSVRSSLAMQLRQSCAKCFVLCGTPAPNSASDLVNQFNLADNGYTFGAFRPSQDKNADWDKIQDLVDSRGLFIRRLKNEILDHVPDKNFHVVRVSMQGKQAQMYDNARTELELELKTLSNETFKKKLTSYFQKRAALLQICACPSAIDPTLNECPAKYTALDRLVENLTSQNRKVIIWSFYKRSIDEICERYKHLNPLRIDGSVTNIQERKEAVTSFQSDPESMILVANPAAAGAGITLHAAYDAIYISYSNQAAHYLQSLDRIHRRGQSSDHVNYYLVVCSDTIEETEIVKLRGKEIRQHNLLGDHIQWPTSLDDALKELSNND